MEELTGAMITYIRDTSYEAEGQEWYKVFLGTVQVAELKKFTEHDVGQGWYCRPVDFGNYRLHWGDRKNAVIQTLRCGKRS